MNAATRTALFEEHHAWAADLGVRIHQDTGSINCSDVEDFRQLALMGLVRAIPAFDSRKGFSFRAYAYKRILGYVRDEIRKLDDVGRSQRDKGQRGTIVSLESTAIATDAQRAMLLRDLLESPRQEDRSAAFEQLNMLLFGLCTEARAVCYMHLVGELTIGQMSCVLGIDEAGVKDLILEAKRFLETQRTRMSHSDQKTKWYPGREPGLFEELLLQGSPA